MSLFETIPNNFFSILSSKNREIYLDALMLLHEAFQYTIHLEVEDYIVSLISLLGDKDLVFEDEEQQDSESIGMSLSQKARFILQKLINAGWVDKEHKEGTFTEIISPRNYAIKILDVLQSISSGEIQEYNSLVFSTYSGLKQAKDNSSNMMYEALLSAKQSTKRLIDELKKLYHSIREFHRNIADMFFLNDLLKSHFDNYKLLVDKIYHPIKTMDSIYRYMLPIQDILTEILADNELLHQMCQKAMTVKLYESEDTANEQIVSDINYIINAYESIGGIVDEIDRKHSAYTRNSIEKMQYLLTADKTLKGKIVEILNCYSKCDENEQEKLLGIMQSNIYVNKQETVDNKSFYHKSVRLKRIDTPPIKIIPSNELDLQEDFQNTISKIQNTFTATKVYNFIAEVLKENGALDVSDMDLAESKNFILLLLAVVRASDNAAPYDIEMLEGVVKNSNYILPHLIFSKKDDEYVDGKIREFVSL